MSRTMNDMAQIDRDSFTALFGEAEEDIQDAGFNPEESAWNSGEDREEGDDCDDE